MSPDDRISPRRFRDTEGVAEWSVLFDGAAARYESGTFERGAAQVAEITIAALDIAAWRDDSEEEDL